MADSLHGRSEDHSRRTDAGHHLRVVPGAGGKTAAGLSQRGGGVLDQRDDPFVEHRRPEASEFAPLELHPLALRRRFERGEELPFRPLQALRGRVSQIHGEHRFARNDIREPRAERRAPDGRHLAGDLPGQPAGGEDRFRRHHAGVPAKRHRRGSGVVRGASNRDLLPEDSLDPGHRAEFDSLRLEDRPLLDVEFEIRRRDRPRQGRLAAVPDSGEFLPENELLAVVRTAAERAGVFDGQPAGIDQTAHHVRVVARTLLVREETDLERAFRPRAGVVQRPDDFEGGEHAQVPVVPSAVSDGIYVRAEQDRVEARRLTRAAADHIPDAVHPDLESGLFHPRTNQVAPPSVLRGERQPLGSALLRLPDLRERGEGSDQPLAPDAETGVEIGVHRPARNRSTPRRLRPKRGGRAPRPTARAVRRNARGSRRPGAGRRCPGCRRDSGVGR